MIFCPHCRSQINAYADVCPQCTRDLRTRGTYAYGSGGEFQLVDMLFWLFIIGIVLKGCECAGFRM